MNSRLNAFGALSFLFLTTTNPILGNPKYDLVIRSRHIYTASELGVVDGAVAIAGGRIVSVSPGTQLTSECQSGCRLLDVPDQFVQPGFHDAHSHQKSGGGDFFELQVSGSSAASIASSVRRFAQANPQLKWIKGGGWNASQFPAGQPTRFDLDKAEATRPVVLSDSDGHQIWANSAAIVMAEITSATPDPEGGRIIRDAQGNPTGLFLERAGSLVTSKMPPASRADDERDLLKGDEVGISMGVTAFQGGGVSLDTIKLYRDLDAAGRLRQRASLWASLDVLPEEFQEIVALARSLPPEGKVHVTTFKGFVDGVISSYTAAMLEPYSDQPSMRGELRIGEERLKTLVLRANAAGFAVALHAIGDRAVRVALDAFAFSKTQLNHNLLNRIEHIETIHPQDIPRFGELNVVASVQPSHMHFGSAGASYYPQRVGQDRLQYTFPWRVLQDSGAKLVFGSDFPVVPQNPFESVFCAIHRQYGNGSPFTPEQRVTPETALLSMTRTPAEIIGMGDELGQIKPGYWADLAIFSADPRGMARNDYTGGGPKYVVAGGRIVFGGRR